MARQAECLKDKSANGHTEFPGVRGFLTSSVLPRAISSAFSAKWRMFMVMRALGMQKGTPFWWGVSIPMHMQQTQQIVRLA